VDFELSLESSQKYLGNLICAFIPIVDQSGAITGYSNQLGAGSCEFTLICGGGACGPYKA
jgi:hypothetical protein